MRNTLIREVLIFAIMMVSVFFVAKTLADRADVDVFEAIFSIVGSDIAGTKSIIWFVNHPTDRQQQIEHCRQDSRLQASKNCVNADFAYQISRQTNANSYPVKQHD